MSVFVLYCPKNSSRQGEVFHSNLSSVITYYRYLWKGLLESKGFIVKIIIIIIIIHIFEDSR